MQQVKKYRWIKKPREDEPVLDDLSAIDHASQRNPFETQDCESEDDTLDATADISVGDCLAMDHCYSVPNNKDEPSLHASQRNPSERQDLLFICYLCLCNNVADVSRFFLFFWGGEGYISIGSP